MAKIFSCDPDCTVGELSATEWMIIVVAFVAVVTAATLMRKWAFGWNKIPESTLMWHVPRFLFISFMVLITTLPGLSLIFDRDIVYLYGKVIAPVVCVFVYLVWLVFSNSKAKNE